VLTRFPWARDVFARVDTHQVSDLYLEGPSGTVFRMQSPTPAVLLIRRVEFDSALARRAVDAGATLEAPVEIGQASQDADAVTLRARDGRSFRAPIVIAADGVNSVIARRLGLNPGWPPAHVAQRVAVKIRRTRIDEVGCVRALANGGGIGFDPRENERTLIGIEETDVRRLEERRDNRRGRIGRKRRSRARRRDTSNGVDIRVDAIRCRCARAGVTACALRLKERRDVVPRRSARTGAIDRAGDRDEERGE